MLGFEFDPAKWEAWATVAIATPVVFTSLWGTFTVLRGTVRNIIGKWRARDQRIGDEAVAKAEAARKIQEDLDRAKKEAEERRVKHAEANAKQEQYNHLVLDLDQRFNGLTRTIAERVQATVQEANTEKVNQLASLQAWADRHEKDDKDSFARNDADNSQIKEMLTDIGCRLTRIESKGSDAHES